MKYQLRKIKSYELELIVTLDKADLGFYLQEAQKYLANDLRIEGFRKGKAPLNLAKDRLDKKRVLETAFDFAFKQSFSDILLKEKFDLINAGDFKIKENSSEKLSYTILLTTFPEFKLADYKDIPVKRNEVVVSEEEVDKTLEFIRNSKKDNGLAPELNDDFARSLGRFRSLKELKEGVGDGLRQEKAIKESQRIQAAVLDKIAENTKIEIPPVLLARQLDQMILELDSDLHRQGLELGLFLAKIEKTQDRLRSEWKPRAEILVKKSLILKAIAKKENIKVESEEIKERVNQFLADFPGIDEAQKNVDLPKLTDQLQQILLNQKVLVFLEKQADHL